MNPTIRIQHKTGEFTTFEFDESIVARAIGPWKLLKFMMALHRAQAFKQLTSLELLPLSGGLAKTWQEERQAPWFEKVIHPTVQWRFKERMDETINANGLPIAIVYGDVDTNCFYRVATSFFDNSDVIAGVHER